MSTLLPLRLRAERYAAGRDEPVHLRRRLGEGTDGEVFETNRATAIKVCKNLKVYENERDAYLHLKRFGFTDRIGEFYLPALWGCNDDLWVVEIDFMHKAPYLIDFGKSTVNHDPEFSEETQRDNEMRGWELFEGNWPRVKRLLADLESIRLFYLDPKPGNIEFD